MNGPRFKPGDKAMRVGTVCSPEAISCSKHGISFPRFGEVLCVEDCRETSLGHQVMFVGFGGPYHFNGYKTGWNTASFRSVEEIRLCMKAVNHHPVEMTP